MMQDEHPEFDKECIDVRDFGAKCDGVTDDSAAFIKAIAEAKHQGKYVRCPGTSYISRPIGGPKDGDTQRKSHDQ